MSKNVIKYFINCVLCSLWARPFRVLPRCANATSGFSRFINCVPSQVWQQPVKLQFYMCAQRAVPAVFSINPLFLMMLLRGGTDAEYDFQENREKSEHRSIKNAFKKRIRNKHYFFSKKWKHQNAFKSSCKFRESWCFLAKWRELSGVNQLFSKNCFFICALNLHQNTTFSLKK